MPRKKKIETTIPKIYQTKDIDVMMYGFIKAGNKYMPALSNVALIKMFIQIIGVDYPQASAYKAWFDFKDYEKELDLLL